MSEAHALSLDSVAPWAEPAPAAGPLHLEQLAALPEDNDWCYELVEGALVRMPPSSFGASKIAGRLFIRLGLYVAEHQLGSVSGEQGGYILDPAYPRQTQVAPDVAFVCAARDLSVTALAAESAFPGAPDLAVEAATPRQTRRALGAKAQRYLSAGARLVWIIWPRRRQVEVWHPGQDKAWAVLSLTDTLDGEDVVPGFRYPVADLFV